MLLIILIAAAILAYFIYVKPFSYWKARNVPHEKPWPLLGNLLPNILQKKSIAELLQDIYNNHPDKRCVGFHQFLLPTLIIRDPDLIKQITVKEFDSFPEHTKFAPEEHDPIWSKNLFAMSGGSEWRDLRSVLSPAFTSCKLRTMYGLITECAEHFVEYISQQGPSATLEMKDAFMKVTNDIIASTAFGVTCNSLKNPNNEIFIMGKDATNFTGFLKNLTFFLSAISPTLARILRTRFISERTTEFFRRIVKETVAVREEKKIFRPDMINLMMEAQKGRLQHDEGDQKELIDETKTSKDHKAIITHDVMVAQAVVFFLAGFDTVSTAMSYTAYELAVNPDVQERLQKEVDEALQDCVGEVTYEHLMSMKYLDMVISEVLRKWPPFAVTDRMTVKSYVVKAKHPYETTFSLDKGVVCQIPIFSLHRDPKYYQDPKKFDPERFSDGKKQKIVPFTYLPFGVGPRNCIGSRFALVEVKVVIFHLVSKFNVEPVAKTPIPIILSKKNVNPLPDEGFWLGLKLRK